MPSECAKVAEHVTNVLTLDGAVLVEEYYYNSLPLCVIDAVFSIGVRYEGVQAVVRRYCNHFGLVRIRPDRTVLPEKDTQESLDGFLARFKKLGAQRMATEVFANLQRTSTRSGILKSEAVERFASTLCEHGIEHLQDIGAQLPSDALDQEIRKIPGQGSGISLQYFWMLAGSDGLIKPDRMILRFLEQALRRQVRVSEAQLLLSDVVTELQPKYPGLTPRLLDFKIWEYQRAATSPLAPQSKKR